MKQLLSSTALAVVLGAAAISAAKADIISLEATDGGTVTTTGLSGGGATVSLSGTTTNFNVGVTGSSDFNSNPYDILNGTTVDAQDLMTSGTQSLTIYVTVQGLLATVGSTISGLTQDFTWTNVPAGWTVAEAMCVDPNDGQFTTVRSARYDADPWPVSQRQWLQ